jgi:hypothetical protein
VEITIIKEEGERLMRDNRGESFENDMTDGLTFQSDQTISDGFDGPSGRGQQDSTMGSSYSDRSMTAGSPTAMGTTQATMSRDGRPMPGAGRQPSQESYGTTDRSMSDRQGWQEETGRPDPTREGYSAAAQTGYSRPSETRDGMPAASPSMTATGTTPTATTGRAQFDTASQMTREPHEARSEREEFAGVGTHGQREEFGADGNQPGFGRSDWRSESE